MRMPCVLFVSTTATGSEKCVGLRKIALREGITKLLCNLGVDSYTDERITMSAARIPQEFIKS